MELMTAKIARFAPRQIATVARAVTVNPGVLRSIMNANLRSLFIAFDRPAIIPLATRSRDQLAPRDVPATSRQIQPPRPRLLPPPARRACSAPAFRPTDFEPGARRPTSPWPPC